MFTLYSGNSKTWAEMTPVEQKTCLIVVGIIIAGLITYGIYQYFKNKKEKKLIIVVFCRIMSYNKNSNKGGIKNGERKEIKNK